MAKNNGTAIECTTKLYQRIQLHTDRTSTSINKLINEAISRLADGERGDLKVKEVELTPVGRDRWLRFIPAEPEKYRKAKAHAALEGSSAALELRRMLWKMTK